MAARACCLLRLGTGEEGGKTVSYLLHLVLQRHCYQSKVERH